MEQGTVIITISKIGVTNSVTNNGMMVNIGILVLDIPWEDRIMQPLIITIIASITAAILTQIITAVEVISSTTTTTATTIEEGEEEENIIIHKSKRISGDGQYRSTNHVRMCFLRGVVASAVKITPTETVTIKNTKIMQIVVMVGMIPPKGIVKIKLLRTTTK
jgi:hypothetical protein